MEHLVLVLGSFQMVASAQEDPLAWFPLKVGSHWVYSHEWKSGNQRRPNVERWTTEEAVTGLVAVPEGIVVLREVKPQSNGPGETTPRRLLGLDGQVREQDADANGGYLVARERQPYLVHGNCVYLIDDGLDGRSQQLRPDYRKYLAEGAVSPDFCFPLEIGRKWGNTDIPWRVEPAGSGGGPPLPEYPSAIHIISDHFGSGGWKDVWFQQGVGVVAEHYRHNGSYDEYTKKLLSFSH